SGPHGDDRKHRTANGSAATWRRQGERSLQGIWDFSLTVAPMPAISVITEITGDHMKLTPAKEKFILHWGEMGTKWGINRTVAQIHALLHVSQKPLDAEEIAETLGIARSNVSTSLKELQSWGIVKVTHVMGDRRDHFESVHDVWALFQIIMDERKKRE